MRNPDQYRRELKTKLREVHPVPQNNQHSFKTTFTTSSVGLKTLKKTASRDKTEKVSQTQ